MVVVTISSAAVDFGWGLSWVCLIVGDCFEGESALESGNDLACDTSPGKTDSADCATVIWWGLLLARILMNEPAIPYVSIRKENGPTFATHWPFSQGTLRFTSWRLAGSPTWSSSNGFACLSYAALACCLFLFVVIHYVYNLRLP